jgi:hypothetical protein
MHKFIHLTNTKNLDLSILNKPYPQTLTENRVLDFIESTDKTAENRHRTLDLTGKNPKCRKNPRFFGAIPGLGTYRTREQEPLRPGGEAASAPPPTMPAAAPRPDPDARRWSRRQSPLLRRAVPSPPSPFYWIVEVASRAA